MAIQRANRKRLLSHKNRLMFLEYYWENMKSDMSKILLADNSKNRDRAKDLSIEIFQIPKQLKAKVLQIYFEFIKWSYLNKYSEWRRNKLEWLGIESKFEWDG